MTTERMTGFTPGPWHVIDIGDTGLYISDGENPAIARQLAIVLADEVGGYGTVYDANANLIAAAPDMHAALEKASEAIDALAVAQCERPVDQQHINAAEQRLGAAQYYVRLALRKARGEA